MNENTLVQAVKNIIKYRFNLDDDSGNEDDVVSAIRKGVEFRGTNLWTLIFAIIIASVGLNVNSTAVIIGAMLISPLMGPIMGIGLGAGVFDFELIKYAAKNLLIATIIGLLSSAIYFFISPLHTAQSELLARTSPTIWDVLIAFFGGLAGIVANSRKNISNVIPGVAIATALMPPLCTAGYGLSMGNLSYFSGAFYLYLINCVFISLATFLMIRFLKFKPIQFIDKGFEIRIKKIIWTIVVFTMLPSIYLAYRFVSNEIFIQRAEKFIHDELKMANVVVLEKNISPENKKIKISVLGEKESNSLYKIMISKKDKYKLGTADIMINQLGDNNYRENLSEIKSGVLEEIYLKREEEMGEKEKQISQLENKIKQASKLNIMDSIFFKEFEAIYGKPQRLSVYIAPVYSTPSSRDTTVCVYIQTLNGIPNIKVSQLEDWIRVKTSIREVKVFIEPK
ncbi:MAG: DUF389 domain-containing protein [Bacteroidetes bacterium]|nr:DUF389 domain-containing protein [Bacteroidota bacterium]